MTQAIKAREILIYSLKIEGIVYSVFTLERRRFIVYRYLEVLCNTSVIIHQLMYCFSMGTDVDSGIDTMEVDETDITSNDAKKKPVMFVNIWIFI